MEIAVDAVLAFAFLVLPFLLGLVLRTRFRWLIALGVPAAAIYWVVAYRDITGDEGDWTRGGEAVAYAGAFALGLVLPAWVLLAAFGRGLRLLIGRS